MISLHARPDFSYVFKKWCKVKLTQHKYIYAKGSQWSRKQALPLLGDAALGEVLKLINCKNPVVKKAN